MSSVSAKSGRSTAATRALLVGSLPFELGARPALDPSHTRTGRVTSASSPTFLQVARIAPTALVGRRRVVSDMRCGGSNHRASSTKSRGVRGDRDGVRPAARKRPAYVHGRASGPGTHSKPRSRSPRHRDSSRSPHETAVSIGLCAWRRSPACDTPPRKGRRKASRPCACGGRLLFVRVPHNFSDLAATPQSASPHCRSQKTYTQSSPAARSPCA